ncbi:MAG: phospholipase D-like domain-containing protein [Acidimicrobiales bacterium]
MVALVALAELLAEVAGSRAGAIRLALECCTRGASALPHRHDDLAIAARHELAATGVLTNAGVVSSSRAAELVIVCEVLAASTITAPVPAPDPKLVLTSPPGTVPLHDHERLDAFVLDVIRQARHTLHIGGAFWNEDGFALLNSVLLPALRVRSVTTTLYVNLPATQYRPDLLERLRQLTGMGPVVVRWFVGARPTMLHAKFVIRDRVHGYLGTANLTSWGMQNHIEAGVELTPGQSERFVTFLEQLDAASLFSSSPPAA